MTEREKMLTGELYNSADEELAAARKRARSLTRRFNDAPTENGDERNSILRELLGACGENIDVQAPFRCDYGFNIRVGERFYANFGVVILDCAQVTIGDDVKLAPNVQIYTAHHPLNAETRKTWLELASPITIGNNVWIGGGAIVLPGVSIGDNSVIGAGSIVTKDIPSDVVAAGNPCRVLRELP
jgi:maltose O-acetyltransferase